MKRPDLDADEAISAARRTFDRNKALIDAGMTFRSEKPTSWRPGKSPSSYSHRSH